MHGKTFSFLGSLFFAGIASVLLFNACGSGKASIEAAERAYEAKKYATAADLYRRSTSGLSKEQRQYVMYRVGDSYARMNQPKQASRWLERAISMGYDSAHVYLEYGRASLALEELDKATEAFDIYLERNPGDSTARAAVDMARRATEWMQKERFYEVYNENTLNTRSSEFAPSFLGKGLMFTSTREPVKGKNVYEWTGSGYLNLYYSERNDRGRWSKPDKPSKSLNTPFNEGVSSFDPANRILYYTQCNGKKGKEDGCSIMAARFNGSGFDVPSRIKLFKDSLTVGHPAISKDGKTLIFVAERPEGLGGKDLWIAYKTGDSTWTDPVNLGPEINTPGDEMFPFLHPDGTLYFASNGHAGMGGLDIFSAYESGQQWYLFENMKYPINSTGDDFGLILNEDKTEGFLASNREGGRGDDDIYSAVKMELKFTVFGRVSNVATKEPVPGARVALVIGGTEKTVETNKDGEYKFGLLPGFSYGIKAAKKGYFGSQDSVSTVGLRESQDFERNLTLELIPKKEIVLKGILYDLDKADLRPESIVVLDTLIQTLNQNPGLVIEIGSHTDSRADSAYNQDLSQRRAQSVVDYLLQNGIAPGRLVAKGYGESQLLNGCSDGVPCTEAQHQANRRTSFRVLREDFVP